MHRKLLLVTFDHYKLCRENMDHCLMESKQQLTCFPYSETSKFKGDQCLQHQIEGEWKKDANNCPNLQYEGLNQDIKWITKLKRRRNLRLRNIERPIRKTLFSNFHFP